MKNAGSAAKSVPVSVIIPTFNRAPILTLCLEHLERQTYTNFDVIVVDDGSADETTAVLERFSRNSSLRLTTFRQANQGQGRARNLAVREAASPLCILIGDDILATPGFVAQHVQQHAENPEEEMVILGLTQWDSRHQELTQFMHWLEDVQFSYRELDGGAKPDWRYLYTSNLSFKTKLLLDHPFDEAFKTSLEDMELGYRLEKAGKLSLRYHPEAFATHVHPTTFLDASRRMQKVGYAEAQFLEAHPDAAQVFTKRHPLKKKTYEFLAAHPALLDLLTNAANRIFGEGKPTVLGSGLLMAHHQRGLDLYPAGR